jgi:copper chaperone CopZ
MLFPFEEYRFASKLPKRQQQLQASLFRAEASHLPEGITEVYRRALTAHEAVQKQIERAPRAVVGALAGAAFFSEGTVHVQLACRRARHAGALGRTRRDAADSRSRGPEHDLRAVPLMVKKSLQTVAGVSQAQIDFAKKTATVTLDADMTNASALIKATTAAGFPSTVRK